MPGLYLLQLMETKENCNIQQNDFSGSFLRGNVIIKSVHTGENFCGDAGDTGEGSSYKNEVTSNSASSGTSTSASSAGTAAAASSHSSSTHKIQHHAAAKAPVAKKVCGSGWGQHACSIIILI